MDKKITVLLLLFSAFLFTAAASEEVTLKKGENIWSIATQYNVSVEGLLEVNGLTKAKAKKLQVGDTILVPSRVPKIYQAQPPYPARFVSVEGLRLRALPFLDAKIIAHLGVNQKVYMLAFTDSFVKVKVQKGSKGWVARKYLMVHRKRKQFPSGISYSRRHIVSVARTKLGARYHWGSAGNGAYDCSGLVLSVFARHGIKLPHSAAQQFAMGKPVKKSELLPGDAVFFTTYKRGASHVGIYIGNGKFIHASTSRRHRGVVVSNLSESYYTRKYIGARRYLH